VRGFDQRLRFVVEHLLADAGADAAVHAAGGHDLDHVDTAAHLLAHARRQLSGPSHKFASETCSAMSGARLSVRSPCPAVAEMPVPASMMRGPATVPAAIASRRASVTPRSSPRLRTVVKPASSVLRALASAW
jgi:hypothetical protein